jgi:hypothetical protein
VSDIETTASALTPNMVKTMTWWCHDGVVHADVDAGTKRALVKRGLAVWETASVPLCVHLTPLGQQVREVLEARAKAEEEAKMQAYLAKSAAERKIRESGYKDGQRVERAACATELNQAIYGIDTWPDRPLGSVWEHLIGLVREHFQPQDAAQPPSSEASPQ